MSLVAVKMLSLYANPVRSILPGRVAEFSPEEAKALVEGGYAEYVPQEEVKEEPAKEETAVMPEGSELRVSTPGEPTPFTGNLDAVAALTPTAPKRSRR